jgi:adenine/guanine phosphoribosyltransferase-like PRPP-binding protein
MLEDAPIGEQSGSRELTGSEKISEIDQKNIHEITESMHRPIKAIANEMREDLVAGNFILIIGDDASGRVPALIFTEIANQMKPADQEKTRCIFFAGSRYLVGSEKMIKTQDIIDQLTRDTESLEMIQKGKVLVVTDTISTGNSILPVTTALNYLGANYEISSIAIYGDFVDEPGVRKVDKNRFEKLFSGKVHYYEKETPEIYGQQEYSGVEKDVYDLHSKDLIHPSRRVGNPSPPSTERELYKRQYLRFVRADAKQMAKNIAEELKTQTN